MKKTQRFDSNDAYEEWLEQYDSEKGYQEIPCIIYKDKKHATMGLVTVCDTYKTALKRFEKAFADESKDAKYWIKFMQEARENGWDSSRGHDATWTIKELEEGQWEIHLELHVGDNRKIR